MQYRNCVFTLFQRMRHPVGVLFCPAENQNTVEIRSLQQGHEQIKLLFSGHRIDRMRHRLGRRTADSDFNHLRITKDPAGESFDLRGQCSRKQQRLTIGRNSLYNTTNIGQKSHVQHPIDFIQNEDVNVSKMNHSLFQMVEQAAWGGCNNIHAPLNFFLLLAVTDSAVDNGDTDIGEAPIIAKSSFHLSRQLAGRFQYEAAKLSVLRQQSENGECKRRSLTGAGLGSSNEIFAGKDQRKSTELNRGGFFKAHRLNSANHICRKSEVAK